MKQKKGIVIITTVLNVLLIAVCAFFYIKTDRKSPAFSFEKSELIYQEGMPQTVLLEGITALDDKDGDVTDKIVIEKIVRNEEEETVTVFYAVSDNAGNIVKTSRIFPADFQTMLATGERGIWTTASLSASEKEDASESEEAKEEDASESEEGNAENAPESEEANAENASKEEAAQRLEEERKKLEETAKQLEEEKKQLEEERKQLEEEKRQQEESTRQAEAKPENTPQADTKPESTPGDKGQKPVITLKAKEVNTTPGNPPAWVNLIQSLKDDRDDYETLFYSLSVSKYDVNKKGSYPVTVTVTDSDGNISAPASLTINVK